MVIDELNSHHSGKPWGRWNHEGGRSLHVNGHVDIWRARDRSSLSFSICPPLSIFLLRACARALSHLLPRLSLALPPEELPSLRRRARERGVRGLLEPLQALDLQHVQGPALRPQAARSSTLSGSGAALETPPDLKTSEPKTSQFCPAGMREDLSAFWAMESEMRSIFAVAVAVARTLPALHRVKARPRARRADDRISREQNQKQRVCLFTKIWVISYNNSTKGRRSGVVVATV